MKKPNISPGPWAQPHDCPHLIYDHPNGGNCIAALYGIENMQANAKAIVALPDLLALAEAVLAHTMSNPDDRALWSLHLQTVSTMQKAGYTF